MPDVLCATCGTPKVKRRNHSGWRCLPCSARYARSWREQNRERFLTNQRRYQLRVKYGIDAETYDRLFIQQNGACAICGSTEADARSNALHIDHDHETGKVRGLLCGNCNNGLGRFGDNPDLLEAAASYLRGE